MTAECTLLYPNGEKLVLTQCTKFSLLRERYQAFAVLHARFLLDEAVEPPKEAIFSLDGRLLHDGMIQNCECRCEKNQWTIQFNSRSYTAVLTKNQLVPGIHANVTLQSLMETYQLPNIAYETGIEAINYIYVKENAAMWDSVIAYNFKLCGGFPYVRVPNLLCVLPQTGNDAVLLPEDCILSRQISGDCSEMISRIDMANAAGEYGSFSRLNPEALARGIVRVRQIALDRQYLYAPDEALRFRIDLSNRRMRTEQIRYIGYCGEDVEDLMQIGTRTARVSRILITGDARGISTTDSFYYDPFCNQ